MEETLEILQDNLGQALIDTAYMVVVSAIIGVVLGTLVALLLYLTENRLFTPNHALNVIVGFIVNAIRSLPFLILMVVLIPVVQLILGDPYTPTVAQPPCRSRQCRSFERTRKARSPKLIRACLRLHLHWRYHTPNHCGCGVSASFAVVYSRRGAHHHFADRLFCNGRYHRSRRHRRYGHSIRL